MRDYPVVQAGVFVLALAFVAVNLTSQRLRREVLGRDQPGQRFHELMEQARYSLDPARRKALYAEATRIIHEEKPWLELVQEVIVYGASKRVSFKPRADYRLVGAEMTAGQ